MKNTIAEKLYIKRYSSYAIITYKDHKAYQRLAPCGPNIILIGRNLLAQPMSLFYKNIDSGHS